MINPIELIKEIIEYRRNIKILKRIHKLRVLEESGEVNRIGSIEELAHRLGMHYKPLPEEIAEQRRHKELEKEFKRIYNGVSIFYGFPYRIK